ncbi:hypothetical protein DPEC_G00340620 [Dallia pectoralis]|uniref:Uncharacterized protein n=1 Tax=Dallia pectoralis TaxID=75939 RepID=A0ACC2F5D0_DALPE|nr:hypothetical protein DPEC_G00340620 [Dallia pectoralis]
MSQSSMGLMDPQQKQQQQGTPSRIGPSYIPTEEERRVFQECAKEGFWYRSLPLTAVAMSVAQALVMKGVLAPSPRFGSLPKVAICGLFGYFGGQMSYAKVCEEKFKKLENSPLADAIRQRRRPISQQFDTQNQSQSVDPNQAFFDQGSSSETEPRFDAHSFSYPSENSYGDRAAPFKSSLSESAPTGAADDNTPGKKNQYGDAWEEKDVQASLIVIIQGEIVTEQQIIDLYGMADQKLFQARKVFLESVTKPVINQLLDDLLEDKVLNEDEKDSVREEYKARAEQARVLIDMVRKKGPTASEKMIGRIQERDLALHEKMGVH